MHILDAHHRFCGEEVDWGFTRYYPLKSLNSLLENNQINVSIFLRIVKDETGVLWHNLIKYYYKSS